MPHDCAARRRGPEPGFETDGGATIIDGASALSPGRAPCVLPIFIFIVLRILGKYKPGPVLTHERGPRPLISGWVVSGPVLEGSTYHPYSPTQAPFTWSIRTQRGTKLRSAGFRTAPDEASAAQESPEPSSQSEARLPTVLLHHPHCTFAYFRGKTVCFVHGSMPSRFGASSKPGAVQPLGPFRRRVLNADPIWNPAAPVLAACPGAALGMAETQPAHHRRAQLATRHGVDRGVEGFVRNPERAGVSGYTTARVPAICSSA